jgi:hypothetical protein
LQCNHWFVTSLVLPHWKSTTLQHVCV